MWGLFYSQDRNEFSNRKVFQPFLNELLYLENVGLNIFGQKMLFVAPLILGDNLGINSVIGFQESFSANHFCRTCVLDKKKYTINYCRRRKYTKKCGKLSGTFGKQNIWH